MKYLLTVCSAMMAIGSAHAQLRMSIGPQLGLNASTAPYKTSFRSYDTGFLAGGSAGAMFSVGGPHWEAQAAVQYAQKGFRIDDSYSDATFGNLTTNDTYRLNYLNVPLNLAYTLSEDGQGLQVFGGGYVGRLLGGRVDYDEKGTLKTPSSTVPYYAKGKFDVQPGEELSAADANLRTSEYYSKAWDLGVQAGLGYRWQGLLVQLSYAHGLKDLSCYGQSVAYGHPSYKLRTVQLSAAYQFRLR